MEKKKRVLFVDDQPNVLSGLRRMMRGFRQEWEMEFVQSGPEALALLDETPCDIVVTDMRMPGMDGAQLLKEIMQRRPETVRIVLSGQTDEEAILRAVGPAHQYLSKPCDPDTLKATIRRACALRDKLAEESLKRLVSRVSTLPSLPDLYSQLVEELQSADVSIQRVGEIISQDVAMSAKLLQLVNSSFFGLPRRVDSPAHAVAMLGLNLIEPLVMSASIFSQFEENGLKGLSLDALVEHSLAVSTLAEQITQSQKCEQQVVDAARLGGLLHDVGQLVLMANLPKEYAEIIAGAREEQIPLYEAEAATIGASHAAVGAYLLRLWAFPDPVVEAIAFHHDPNNSATTEFSPLTAVHVSNVLVNESASPGSITLIGEVDMEYLDRIGLADSLPDWRDLHSANCC